MKEQLQAAYAEIEALEQELGDVTIDEKSKHHIVAVFKDQKDINACGLQDDKNFKITMVKVGETKKLSNFEAVLIVAPT